MNTHSYQGRADDNTHPYFLSNRTLIFIVFEGTKDWILGIHTELHTQSFSFYTLSHGLAKSSLTEPRLAVPLLPSSKLLGLQLCIKRHSRTCTSELGLRRQKRDNLPTSLPCNWSSGQWHPAYLWEEPSWGEYNPFSMSVFPTGYGASWPVEWQISGTGSERANKTAWTAGEVESGFIWSWSHP